MVDEWLETDGLGGYAMATVPGWRTRRYHGLLVPAIRPPTERAVLVAGLDAFVQTAAGETALSAHRYAPDVTAPRGDLALESFAHEPWPTWTFRLADGSRVVQEVVMARRRAAVVVRFRRSGAGPARLRVRPFLLGRDSHALHHVNDVADLAPERDGTLLRWRLYAGIPPLVLETDGAYRHEPFWYRDVLLEEEAARGFEHLEDASSPGVLEFDLADGATLVFAAEGIPGTLPLPSGSAVLVADALLAEERERRRSFPTPLHRAADAYLVARGDGATIIAGYPWFTDWGRDTFIAMRGICLETDRLAEAGAILAAWASALDGGMLPNRFIPGEREFNAVDASLWFVIAVGEYLARRARVAKPTGGEPAGPLEAAHEILSAYERGARFAIGCDPGDGLLHAGVPGQQLTWMDARAGGREVTPRIGKPVEVQALWINALRIGAGIDPRWSALADRAERSFGERFWNAGRGCLHDVVDVDGIAGTVDDALRPNQILAVGGLPRRVIGAARAASVVEVVERRLLTPLGLRTLDPDDPAYRGRYEGGPVERDGAYHQGTAWPWLLGPFVDAWLRVRADDPAAVATARGRFLEPLRASVSSHGLGHVCEIADGDEPQRQNGCPFQAWSVGALLQIEARLTAAS